MKYRYFSNLISIIFLSVSLSGCVIYERIRLKLDLSKMTGQIEYFNIVSAIEKKDKYWENDLEKEDFLKEVEQTRIDDFGELLKEYKDYSGASNKEVISKKLVRKKKQLNGIVKFKLKSLEEFDISINSDSTQYVMKLDEDSKYIESNGAYLETNSGNYVSWNVDVKNIDVIIKPYDLENGFDYTVSMLSYWQQWKKTN